MTTPIHYLSINELNEKYRAGEISPIEVTQHALDRIAKIDPKVSAFICITVEAAEEAAKLAEREMREGHWRGPLHGVPIGLKDLCDMAGVPTTGGSTAWKDLIVDEDATVVARLRQAGAVVLGKLAMTEGAFVEHVEGMPEPRNPWNMDYATGLSSSGPAVAVAAGLCWGALGSDTGGSIRFPSIACGITGLKPTWGRVSRFGIMPLAPSLDHIGPMARTADDVAAILNVIAGFDASDPTTHPGRVPNYCARSQLDVTGLRIGFDADYCADGVDVSLYKSIMNGLDVLAGLGAQISSIKVPPTNLLTPHFTDLVAAEAAVAHADVSSVNLQMFGPVYRNLLERGRKSLATRYVQIREAGLKFSGELRTLFNEVDTIVCPPWPTPALLRDFDAIGDLDDQGSLLRFTAPYNISGNPAITVPCGFNSEGLPLALQLIGRSFEEDVLLRIACAYQRETSWHKHFPKL